jgi:hypothetical protein
MTGKAIIHAAKPAKTTARSPVLRRAPVPVRRADIQPRIVQPALKVGAANDPLEHEAEAMAERVVSMPVPSFDTPPRARPAATPQARRFPKVDQDSQPDTETFETAPNVPADHQDPEVPNTEDVDTAGLDEDEFGEIESGAPAQAEPPARASHSDAGMAAVGPEGGAAPADVGRAVAQPGAGRPLPAPVRSFMEPRFGVDFSDVRIHDGPGDRQTSERIGARAFTHREHIWLGEGERVEDRRLLAHELTHVVQQTKRQPVSGVHRMEAEESEPEVRRGWAANKAEKVARNVPGYTLLTVILGRSPITGDRVTRNAENLVGGFLGLLPGGEQIFKRLKETRALERAFDWVSKRLSQLNITWSRIKGLVSKFIEEMPAWSPLKVAKRIFRPLVNDIITFVSDIKDKILEFVVRGALALAGPWGEKVWAIIKQAKDTISMILRDPLKFAGNLMRSVVQGFKQFGARIWTHLKAGLMGWLFGTLQNAGIELPAKLDFKGIVSVVLQVLGLTYANFRAMLVKKLGKNGEKKVAFLEKSVAVVKTLLTEGFIGIWKRIVESIEKFKQTVIDGIRNFVIQSIVMGALSWVAGLSNPVGAIIKVVLAIYNVIKTFLERMDQIVDVAKSIFSSIGAIAKGQVKQAADFIEKTIAATIPVFLAFVSALIPVTGITKTIKLIIKKLSDPAKNAMKKLVVFLVKKAKKLFSKVLGKVNKKRKIPAAGFAIGKAKHELIPKKKGKKFTLEIASKKPKPADAQQTDLRTEAQKAAEFGDDSKCVDAFEEAFKTEINEAEASLTKVKPEQKQASTNKTGDKANQDTQDAGKKLAKLGPCIADNPYLEDEPKDGAIIRAREPRIPEIEGDADTYTERGKVTKQAIKKVVKEAGLGPKGEKRLSNYYENDHIPEQSLAKLVQTYVQGDLKAFAESGQRSGTAAPDPLLGTIDTIGIGKKGGPLPALTIYRPIHRQKSAEDASRTNHQGIVDKAKKKTSLEQKISTLQAGIKAEMRAELKTIAEMYGSDPAASKAIRTKIRAGMTKMGDFNKPIYGIEPGNRPTIKKAGAGTPPGSDLPMSGDASTGLPDFSTLEGAYSIYNEKPKKVGNYLEYDHVIEATMGEKASKLTLKHSDFSGGLEGEVISKAQERADAEGTPPPKEGMPPARRIKATGMRRLNGLKELAFKGKPVASYKRDKAGTVGLYRPVHREITPEQSSVKEDILKGANLDAARAKLVEFAVAPSLDRSLKDAAVAYLHAAVRTRFETEIDSHIDLIKNAYKTELKEFLMINRSRTAANKMAAVAERVGGTLRRLRAESIAMIS